jgi:hypothetical protein
MIYIESDSVRGILSQHSKMLARASERNLSAIHHPGVLAAAHGLEALVERWGARLELTGGTVGRKGHVEHAPLASFEFQQMIDVVASIDLPLLNDM